MIEYEEEWIIKLLFRTECKVALRALIFAFPATIFAVLLNMGHVHLEDIIESSGLPTVSDDSLVKRPTTWLALSAFIVLLLDFRTTQALSRFWEGTSLLHQMRGEWFDSVSCLVTFAMPAVDSKPKEVMIFRHTIVRLMSLCHGAALEEIADSDSVIARLDSQGIDDHTLQHLKYCKETYGFNRIEMVLKTIYTLMTKALDEGVLKIPPPILTRVYQTLSRGFVCILNAKKITDTSFPFPYAQLIAVLLLIIWIGIPCVIAMLIRNAIWAGVFTFVPVFGLFSLNFIASELENPFGHDDNDLPLTKFQAEMNSSLLMLLHGNADLVASLSEDAVLDFFTLARDMNFWKGEESHKMHRRKSRMSDFENFAYPEEGELGDGQPNEASSDVAPDDQKHREMAASLGISEAELHVRKLAKSIVEFNRTLQRWTRTVESQVGELRRSYDAIKNAARSASTK
mmetsp:Transcript_28752/g.82284  ORF Transcript_28752/g.82284 Transcript_28752/m.82284 type:complete len:456 (-) Transcript_28752:250-1617(-)